MSAVIVTDAGGAIGQSIARRFSEEGRRVVCVDRDERVLDVCDELDDAVPCVVDLTAGRAADPAEVAEAVAYLASARVSYITGQMLLACGGRSVAG